MSRNAPVEDLLVLARQCKLSEEEERRFEIAKQSSRELECLYDAGLHFDDEASLLPGDETRFSRLVERTLERLDQGAGVDTPRRSNALRPGAARASRASLVVRYFAASLGFGMLLCVTLASAWDYVEKRAAERAQQAKQASAQAAARPPRRLHAKGPGPVAAPVPNPPTETAERLRQPAPISQEHRAVAASEQLSSSELFARANQARRNGDIEEASSLYERLGKAYPGSAEAEDAKILRGNLLLSQRSPRAALRQFEDYHSEALSLEALWGRAQALRKLSSPDERAVLIELVRGYPDSPQAEAAKKRLGELAR